jgi:K+-sensing histidine kinase KdpD
MVAARKGALVEALVPGGRAIARVRAALGASRLTQLPRAARRAAVYVLAALGFAALTAALLPFRDRRPLIAAMFYVVLVQLAALWGGMRQALGASLLATACFDFFFLPPYGSFSLAYPLDGFVLATLIFTSILVGGLSERARARAAAAEEGRRQLERLYSELERENAERRLAEEETRRLNLELEERVRARTAQLELANEELESFSYSVSHDLRAPLRHIAGFVNLLQKRAEASLDETGRRYLSVIFESAHRLDRLITDLLTFSRMGRSALGDTPVDLDKTVRAAIAELSPETRGRAVVWQVGELPVVRGDPQMLKLAMANLLGNAVKFTGPRERAVIEVGSLRGAAEEHAIYVRDNGVGFDMRYADKLFGVFQRLHDARDFEGTGIGLATVRRIVVRHGGRTWAEGRVGEGATFYVSLPRDGRLHAE